MTRIAGFVNYDLYIRALCGILGLCVLVFIFRTWHWPLVGDAGLLHYVVFLADHGMAPYRNIIDPNMPATYLIEGVLTQVFGFGALAWRMIDLALMLSIGAGMISIAGPDRRSAGFLAAGIMTLIHGRDGLTQLGQRDLLMAAFVIAAYAFLFKLLRNPQSARKELLLAFLFGGFVGFAAGIKPTALLLLPPLLVLIVAVLQSTERPWKIPLAAIFIGLLVPTIAMLLFLLRTHSLGAFLQILDNLIPYHAQMFAHPMSYMVTHLVSSVMLPLVLLWLPVGIIERIWTSWEGAALLVGFLFGAVSFCIQRRAYPYHRYPSEAFLLLWIALDLLKAIRRSSPSRSNIVKWLASMILAYAVLILGISSTVRAVKLDWRDQDTDHMLQADLNRLGGKSLSGHVQCMDMASGCINTLLEMRLVQDTGFLYDCYMFAASNSPEKEHYREQFWRAIQSSPPEVFIVTSDECGLGADYKYRKLRAWPLLDQYLTSHYELYADRVPSRPVNWWRNPTAPVGYEIYLRMLQRDESGHPRN